MFDLSNLSASTSSVVAPFLSAAYDQLFEMTLGTDGEGSDPSADEVIILAAELSGDASAFVEVTR